MDSPPADVGMQWGIKIPLRDGTRLNATLYLPGGQQEPAPTIFTLTPYIGQTYHDCAMYFAAHGYPFLTVDVRGRGNSEGDFRPLIGEAADCFDVIEWVARQQYCNGKVSMWGGSYGGYVQWAGAKELPPHLATLVPVASPYLGVDFPIRNNIAAPYWMQWLTLVAGRTLQDKIFWNNERYWGELFRRWFESGAPFDELDAQIGQQSAAFQEWTDHPYQDSYWDSYNPTPEQYARIDIPVLTITGIYDGDQLGALKHYAAHLKSHPRPDDVRHYFVIGPWDHAGTRAPTAKFCGVEVGPDSLVDLLKLHVEWYDWTMRGGPRPTFLERRVAYYVMVAEKWRYANSLEEATARSARLYLDSNGSAHDVFRSGWLSAEAPLRGGADQYSHDPLDTSLASLESTVDPENRADQRMVHASVGRQLVYHSDPLEQDTEVTGFFRLSAWLSINQPDADFRVKVYDVALDAAAVQLTVDSMRARYRESLREPKLVASDAPLFYEFSSFMFVSRLIRKGHRLRLVIGPVHSIYSQRNFNSGGEVARESARDARTVLVRLFHGPSHPSALYVPLGASDTHGL